MKGKTSRWFAGLTLRSMKDLINLLFDADHKLREHRHYDLFLALLRCLDDEYHAYK